MFLEFISFGLWSFGFSGLWAGNRFGTRKLRLLYALFHYPEREGTVFTIKIKQECYICEIFHRSTYTTLLVQPDPVHLAFELLT